MPVPQAHRQKSGGRKRRQKTISQNLALPLSLGQRPPCQGPLRRQNPLHPNRRPNHGMGTRETNIIRRPVPDRANCPQRHPDRRHAVPPASRRHCVILTSGTRNRAIAQPNVISTPAAPCRLLSFRPEARRRRAEAEKSIKKASPKAIQFQYTIEDRK